MKRLLYCIFQHDGREAPAEWGPEMAVVHCHDLAVATSPWSDEEPANRFHNDLDVARLVAYEKTIAVLHSTRTVVPLRFGCVMEDRSQIVRLLEEHEAEFAQLLGQLEGLAEMGLRVWWESPPEEPLPRAPGARYLAAARVRQAGLSPLEERWADQLCGPLEGFYVQQKREARPVTSPYPPGGRLLSLHFLVARTAAEDFRERVQRLALPGEVKVLISGPWPPYNFVDHAGP